MSFADGAIEERQEELDGLHKSVFGSKSSNSLYASGAERSAVDLDDVELLRRAMEAENGEKFRRLWNGQWEDQYESQSEADLALCSMLAFWTGKDPARIDSLFRQSRLVRRKWLREDYRLATINAAIDRTTDVWIPVSARNEPDRTGRKCEGKVRGAFTNVRSRPPNGSYRRRFPLTEIGNAERLVARHGEELHYSHTLKKWLVWDRVRWVIDQVAAVKRRAKETIRALYKDAFDEPDEELRQATSKFALRSDSEKGIRHVLARAAAEEGIPIQITELDPNEWLLNCRNGTIDLRTGDLLQHNRRHLITKLAPVEYDPAAECPRWEEFLNEVFEQHPDLVPFIQRAIGYSLTGNTREECMFLLYGTGRNGKGTIIKTITTMLGDYAGTADFSTFVATRDDRRPRDDIAHMKGKRFISSQESREGAALAESLIKWLTGGDMIRARRLYENSFEFEPTHKIWLATNHKPIVRGTDRAIWSRIKLLPFQVSFEGREDRTLKTALLEELPGILAWFVEGCLTWQKEGLAFPESVTNATREYRNESDQVGRFIDECCVLEDSATVRGRRLYVAYRRWAENTGQEELTETAFGRRLIERQVKRNRTKSGNVYRSIGLRSEA